MLKSSKKISLYFLIPALLITALINPNSILAAVSYTFQNTQFVAEGDQIRNTYSLNGEAETTQYNIYKDGSNASFQLQNILCPGFKKDGTGYLYELLSSDKHTQTAAGRTTMSPFFLLVAGSSGATTYSASGIYYRTHMYDNASQTCYAKTLQASGEYRDTQSYEAGWLKSYLEYVNGQTTNVVGIGDKNTNNPFSISGTIKINYDGATQSSQKSGDGDFPDSDTSHAYNVSLWRKSPSATNYTFSNETATIDRDGKFSFENKIRPAGSYVVASLIYTTGSDFTAAEIDSLGSGSSGLTVTQSSYTGDITTAECFGSKSDPAFDIPFDAPSKEYTATLVNKTLGVCKASNMRTEPERLGEPACDLFKEGGWVYAKILAKPVCIITQLLVQGAAEFTMFVASLLDNNLY